MCIAIIADKHELALWLCVDTHDACSSNNMHTSVVLYCSWQVINCNWEKTQSTE